MPVRSQLVIDCADPDRLARFWTDRISDQEGHGPSIWFHVVPAAKAVKNRLHLDIHASGERKDPIETRRKRVDAEASRPAWAPPSLAHCPRKDWTTTRSG